MRNYQDPNELDTQPDKGQIQKQAKSTSDTERRMEWVRRCMYHRGEWPRVPDEPVWWCLRCCPESSK